MTLRVAGAVFMRWKMTENIQSMAIRGRFILVCRYVTENLFRTTRTNRELRLQNHNLHITDERFAFRKTGIWHPAKPIAKS